MLHARSIAAALAAALFLPLPFAGGQFARAADAPPPAASSCDVGAELDALTPLAARAALTNDLDSLLAELAARKHILRDVLACATAEVGDLRAQVASATPPNEPRIAELQSQLLSGLDETNQYYANQKARIPDLGIRGSKDLAKEIADWREATFAPLRGRASDFVLWNRNQPLFKTAAARLADSERTVRFFKFLNEESVQAISADAHANLAKAEDLNARAEQSFFDGSDPADTLALIKGSLDALAATYQNFFDLSDTVRELLPAARP